MQQMNFEALSFIVKRTLVVFLFSMPYSLFAQQQTLDHYLSTAIQKSPLFVDNANQVRSLAYDSMHLKALYKPQVNFNSFNDYAPIINGYGYDKAISNGGIYSALVGTNITFIGKNNISNQLNGIKIETDLTRLNGKLSERELKQNISAQYIIVYGEQELLRNAKDLIELMGKENVLLKQLAEKGTYKEIDYLTFIVNYNQQKLTYEQQKLQIQNDLALLNYYSGIVDTAYAELQDPSIQKKEKIVADRTLPFKQFFLDSIRLKNTFDQIKFDYKPRLNLFGDAGLSSSSFATFGKNFGVSAGFSVNIPIYDGNQKSLRYGKIKLAENTRLSYMQFFRDQYEQRALQLLQQIGSTDLLITQAQQQLKLSEALITADQKILATGDVRMPDYILSLNNYISAKVTLLQLTTSKMQLINEFNYLNY